VLLCAPDGQLTVKVAAPCDVRRGDQARHSKAMSEASRRVRRTSVAERDVFSGQRPNFACAYEVDLASDDKRSPEEWARAAWEGAPAPLRGFMLVGWRFVLGLRLGPRSSPDHILGWRITERSPEETVCQLSSSFLDASNTFRRVGGRLVWSTFVTYDRPIARVIWPPVSLLHRLLVRVALRRAARHRLAQ
jgi:hypothetical protein